MSAEFDVIEMGLIADTKNTDQLMLASGKNPWPELDFTQAMTLSVRP
jgi:hypothetical protein